MNGASKASKNPSFLPSFLEDRKPRFFLCCKKKWGMARMGVESESESESQDADIFVMSTYIQGTAIEYSLEIKSWREELDK